MYPKLSKRKHHKIAYRNPNINRIPANPNARFITLFIFRAQGTITIFGKIKGIATINAT